MVENPFNAGVLRFSEGKRATSGNQLFCREL